MSVGRLYTTSIASFSGCCVQVTCFISRLKTRTPSVSLYPVVDSIPILLTVHYESFKFLFYDYFSRERKLSANLVINCPKWFGRRLDGFSKSTLSHQKKLLMCGFFCKIVAIKINKTKSGLIQKNNIIRNKLVKKVRILVKNLFGTKWKCLQMSINKLNGSNS